MAEIEQFLSKDAEKQVKDLVKLMSGLAKSYEQAFKSSKKLDEQITKTSKTTQKQKEQRKELTAIEKEEARILKATETTEAKLDKIRKKSNKILVEKRQELQKTNKELNTTIALENKQIGTLEKLALKNQQLNSERKKLNLETKKGQARLKEINRELDKNNRFISKNADALTKQKRGIGRYADAIKGVAARFVGWGIAIAAVTRALKSGIEIVLNYSKANSTLNAILGVTSKDTKSLTKQQQELGKSTAFSATQVTKAQTELARLGLSIAEITKLTPSILNAAVAFGVDMAQAAELVAGQLNAFNLAATEGKRVSDVLVKATQISAFTYQRLFDALRVVSPAADAVGVSIEETTAILSAAVDANIDASTASTALRNIFIELADQGLTWDEAMESINTSTNRLSKANELFGKRGAVVATVIANNTEKIDENTEALNNSAGAAEAFAKEQLDNLRGDMVLLTSAWEGFILGIETGDGALARFVRGSLQLFTKILGKLTPALETQREELTKQKIELTALVTAIQRANDKEELRERLITKLNKQYPEFLKNIDAESLSNEILTKRLKEVNDELERKFLIQLKEEELQKLFIQLTEARLRERDATINLAKANVVNFTAVEDLVEAEKRLVEAYKTGNAEIIENAKLLVSSLLIISDSQSEQKKLRDEIERVSTAYDELGDGIDRVKTSLSELGDEEEEEIKRLIKIERLVAELPPKYTKLQQGLFALTDRLFGKNTIDEDAQTFLQKIGDSIKNVAGLAEDARKDDIAADEKAEREKAENRKEIISSSIELATEVFQGFTDLRIQQLSDESTALEVQRQTALTNVEGDKNKEAQINAQFDKKQAVIKQKQFKEEQKGAIFQIAIQTGVNIVKVFPNIALMALALALGFANVAFVKAQKPPKFGKGSKGLQKDTYAEVGEAGRELLFMPGGGVAVAEKSTKAMLPKGTIIKTNRETEQILAANQLRASRENDVAMRDYSELVLLGNSIAEDRKSILKAVNDRDQYIFQVSKEGVKTLMKNSRGTTTYLDTRFR